MSDKIKDRLVLALLIVVGISVWISVLPRNVDFNGYVWIGKLVWEGKHIYEDSPSGLNTWPPVFSLFGVVWYWLSIPSVYLSRSLWILLNFYLLLKTIWLCTTLVYRKPISIYSFRSLAIFLPVLFTSRYILSNFHHLQINILIFYLTLKGLVAHQQGKSGIGALWLSIAIAFKVTPILFVGYFLIKKQWKMILYTMLLTSLWYLLPFLIFSPDKAVSFYHGWMIELRQGWGVNRGNQSVFAMIDRAFGHHLIPFIDNPTERYPVSGRLLVTIIYWSFNACIGLISVLVMTRSERKPVDVYIEWSIVFIGAALFGLVTWKNYLICLYLPHVIGVYLWQNSRQGSLLKSVLTYGFLGSFLLSTISEQGIMGAYLSDHFQLASNVTLSGLIILGLLFWLRWKNVND